MTSPGSWFRDRAARVRSFWALEWVGQDDLYLQKFSEVVPRLHVGGMPSVDNSLQLRERGITHVVSCIQARKRGEVEFLAADFEHLFLSAHDEMHQDMGETFDRFFAFVDEAREKGAEPTVLVHCEVGVSRSATLAIALLMRDNGHSFLDSFNLVRSRRIQILPNIAFASQLQRFEHELRPDLRTFAPSSLAVFVTRYCNAPCDIAELQDALRRHDFDAPAALRSIYGGEIPRVVQGVRSASR